MTGISAKRTNDAQKKLLFLLGILGITLLVSLPLFAEGIHRGHDTRFHLSRIEGIANELSLGVFPVKISSFWMDGYGYPVSVYYGDILLYFPALLRLAGVPLVCAYKIFLVTVNFLTTLIAFLCFDRIFTNKNIALLTGLVYVTAYYRLINLYVRSAVGEYCSMMFLPLIALAVHRIYSEAAPNPKTIWKNATLLAAGMSGLLETHLLSTEMTAVILLIVALVFWKKTFRLASLKTYLLAIAETILWNLFFLVPFLDYYLNVPVRINSKISDSILHIQEQGTPILQSFLFFHDPFHNHIRDVATPGPALMLVFVVGIIFLLLRKTNREMKVYLFFSAALLFVASNLFPWDFLAEHIPFGNLLAQIQFPWRYVGLASIFLTLLLGSLMSSVFQKKEDAFSMPASAHSCIPAWLVIGLCLGMTCLFSSVYYENESALTYRTTEELPTYIMGGKEYLRAGSSTDNLSGWITAEQVQTLKITERKGTSMKLYAKTGETEAAIELPLFYYKGYHVVDEYGTEYPIEDGTNHVIRFVLPPAFSGSIQIAFAEPWYWRAAELISVLALLAAVGMSIQMSVNLKEQRKSI